MNYTIESLCNFIQQKKYTMISIKICNCILNISSTEFTELDMKSISLILSQQLTYSIVYKPQKQYEFDIYVDDPESLKNFIISKMSNYSTWSTITNLMLK